MQIWLCHFKNVSGSLASSPSFSFVDLQNKIKLPPFHSVISPVLVFHLLFWQILHQHSSWEQHIYYPLAPEVRSLTQVSLGWDQGIDRAVFPSGGARRESISLPFMASSSTLIPWLTDTCLHLQSQKCSISLTLLGITSPSLTLSICLPLPPLRTLTGLTQITWGH